MNNCSFTGTIVWIGDLSHPNKNGIEHKVDFMLAIDRGFQKKSKTKKKESDYLPFSCFDGVALAFHKNKKVGEFVIVIASARSYRDKSGRSAVNFAASLVEYGPMGKKAEIENEQSPSDAEIDLGDEYGDMPMINVNEFGEDVDFPK